MYVDCTIFRLFSRASMNKTGIEREFFFVFFSGFGDTKIYKLDFRHSKMNIFRIHLKQVSWIEVFF